MLANRYRITSFIGQGSTGAVFRADDVIVNKPVAVRILVPALAQQPLLARIHVRIDRNKEITRQHPGSLVNLVDITDAGMTLDGEIFVVTDFIDGDHLSTMLGRGGRLPWSRARSLFIRLGQLIQELHNLGIVLGTLQARHCYAVRGKVKQEAIKIVNHAIFERVAADLGPTAGPDVARAARYLAPEVACGEAVDVRTDVYSFGIITHELLTGVPPFIDANAMRLVAMHLQRSPRPPSDLVTDLPAEIDAVVLRSLAKAPADRFQSMAAFVAALEAVPQNATRPAPAPTPVVSASAAATEIPPPSHAPASPLAAAALASTASIQSATGAPNQAASIQSATGAPHQAAQAAPVQPAAAPTPELAITSAPPAHVASPGTAATTLAATNATTPPAADTRPDEAAAGTSASSASQPSRPESAAVPVVRSSPASPSRPATIPPGGLRLPPPPTLGRPTPFAPPTLGAPVPGAHSPSAALPRPPSAGLPRADATAISGTIEATAPAPVPQDSPLATAPTPTTPAPVPQDSPLATAPTPTTPAPVPQDSPLATAASSVTPSPAPGALATASAAEPPAKAAPTPQVHATLVPGSVEALAVERALPATGPKDTEPRAASSASSARRPVIHLTDIRGPAKSGDDSASSSGAYLRVALADSTDPARPRSSTAEPTAKAELESKPRSEARAEPRAPAPVDPRQLPVVSGDALRAAALHQSPANPASLSQVSGTSDSIIAELPRRRSAVLIGGAVGLLAVAGIAMLILTRPPAEPRGDVAANEAIARKLPAPLEPGPTAPARPTDPTVGDTAASSTRNPTEPPTVVAAIPAPSPEPETEPEPEPESKPGKKTKPGAKKPRRTREVEPEEPDIFDQVRAHMNQQKAEEEARKAALASSQAPKEPLSDADRARETLDRARQASNSNNLQLCFSLARQSNTLVKSQEALELMGTCACRLKNETSARVAYNALSGDRRDKVASTCSAVGISL